MRLTAVAALLVVLGATSACTTTKVSGIGDPDPCWTGGGDLDEAESQDSAALRTLKTL